MSYYLWSGVNLNPLNLLSQTAKEIESGNYKRRFDIKSGDEIEALGRVIDKMTLQLVKAKEKAEKKVKDRTKELELMNQSMVGRELKMIELKKQIKKLKQKIKQNKK